MFSNNKRSIVSNRCSLVCRRLRADVAHLRGRRPQEQEAQGPSHDRRILSADLQKALRLDRAEYRTALARLDRGYIRAEPVIFLFDWSRH